jgi:nicotinamidase/pyrazinamidase
MDVRSAFDAETALVVVDLQNDFADPAGSLAVAGAGRVVSAANAAVETALEARAAVVLTQDWHPPSTPHFAKDGGPWPVHCVAGTWGAELHPAFRAPGDAVRVLKGVNGEDGYSGFTMRDPVTGEEAPTTLEITLRGRRITRVVLCGLATDYCVLATALDAVRLGFRAGVLREAVAAVDVASGDGERALERMAGSGIQLI